MTTVPRAGHRVPVSGHAPKAAEVSMETRDLVHRATTFETMDLDEHAVGAGRDAARATGAALPRMPRRVAGEWAGGAAA